MKTFFKTFRPRYICYNIYNNTKTLKHLTFNTNVAVLTRPPEITIRICDFVAVLATASLSSLREVTS